VKPQNVLDEEIIKRLNILIAILLEQSSKADKVSMTDKIGKLAELGISQPDIAKILGKPLNYVTALLSQKKSRKKDKNNG
jgi:hypothetical protein